MRSLLALQIFSANGDRRYCQFSGGLTRQLNNDPSLSSLVVLQVRIISNSSACARVLSDRYRGSQGSDQRYYNLIIGSAHGHVATDSPI